MKSTMLAACVALAVAAGTAGYALLTHNTWASLPEADAFILGEKLFHDAALSADGKTSCATCHIPAHSFSDGRSVAVGTQGREGTRNTPSLTATITSARTAFFWDGRRDRLEDAVMDPFSNPVEMGLHDRRLVAEIVSASTTYAAWFPAEVISSPERVDRRIAESLAAYVRGIPVNPTRFELFAQGDASALDDREKLGMRLFSGKGQCATCHMLADARLTDNAFHRSGVTMDDIAVRLPELTQGILDRNLAGSALGDRVATHGDEAQLGHFAVSHKATDVETFATPPLREVRLTAPYMHDGSVKTLDDAVDREVYYRGLDTGYPIGLTAQERGDLRAFLEAL